MREIKENEEITWVYASVSVARSVGWIRVKSGWCVERGSDAWWNGVVVSDSEIRVRELGRRVRDWKIKDEIGN